MFCRPEFAIVVNVRAGILDVVVSVPVAFHDQTRGLLGVVNDNKTDDFTTPSGDVIPWDSSEEDIFHQFGQLCMFGL